MNGDTHVAIPLNLSTRSGWLLLPSRRPKTLGSLAGETSIEKIKTKNQ
jgi:hypothetical protein